MKLFHPSCELRPQVDRDPALAARLFEHAHWIARDRHFDEAINVFMSALWHDPGNLARHRELRELAKMRKVTRGKPIGRFEFLNARRSATDEVDIMLVHELAWTKDPFSLDALLDLIEAADLANAAEPEHGISLVANWFRMQLSDARQMMG